MAERGVGARDEDEVAEEVGRRGPKREGGGGGGDVVRGRNAAEGSTTGFSRRRRDEECQDGLERVSGSSGKAKADGTGAVGRRDLEEEEAEGEKEGV